MAGELLNVRSVAQYERDLAPVAPSAANFAQKVEKVFNSQEVRQLAEIKYNPEPFGLSDEAINQVIPLRINALREQRLKPLRESRAYKQLNPQQQQAEETKLLSDPNLKGEEAEIERRSNLNRNPEVYGDYYVDFGDFGVAMAVYSPFQQFGNGEVGRKVTQVSYLRANNDKSSENYGPAEVVISEDEITGVKDKKDRDGRRDTRDALTIHRELVLKNVDGKWKIFFATSPSDIKNLSNMIERAGKYVDAAMLELDTEIRAFGSLESGQQAVAAAEKTGRRKEE